jgi:hypothetical protein
LQSQDEPPKVAAHQALRVAFQLYEVAKQSPITSANKEETYESNSDQHAADFGAAMGRFSFSIASSVTVNVPAGTAVLT